MDNSSIVKTVIRLLSADNRWEKAYSEYADNILNPKQRTRYFRGARQFRLPKPMYAYSSIYMAGNTMNYDIRVYGQSVGTISVKDEGVKLTVSEEKKNRIETYFKLPSFEVPKGTDWKTDSLSKDFRALFRGKVFGRLKSEEHRIENFLLAEFAKRGLRDGKQLGYIQPVKFNKCFFQLTTPIKASNHKKGPSFSMSKKDGATGGGIDIMARITHNDGKSKLAIIELKDENKKGESQNQVMQQALSYATFVAYLLRSKSADKWWKIFGYSGPIPKSLDLDVISLMPKGDSEEGNLSPIPIKELSVKLNPYTLYYELDSDGIIRGFEGTLLNNIRH